MTKLQHADLQARKTESGANVRPFRSPANRIADDFLASMKSQRMIDAVMNDPALYRHECLTAMNNFLTAIGYTDDPAYYTLTLDVLFSLAEQDAKKAAARGVQ